MHMHMHKRHGFTLIELLVVVAIITALLSMLMPSMSSAVALARSVKCQSVLRQTALANVNYAADEFGSYVYSYQHPLGNGQYNGVSYRRYWATDIAFIKYLDMAPDEVSNAFRPDDPAQPGFRAGCQWPESFRCPDDGQPRWWPYADTYWGHKQGIGYFRAFDNRGYRLSDVIAPAQKFQFADADGWWMRRWASSYKHYFDLGTITHGGWGGILPRHELGGAFGANVAFYDAHVERVPIEDTYYYTTPGGTTPDVAANAKHWNPAGLLNENTLKSGT